MSVKHECYGTRIFSIHLVNAPSYMGTALAVMKRAFKPKLFSRITAHDSSRELLDLYPKEILPKDFGGEERSLAELADEWYSLLCQKDTMEFLKQTETWKSDESKRVGGKLDAEIYGMNGTFKKLDID